ncbi:unnamed protein product [Lymnaea stagnalis]|uniref:Uncharacterized protein n=1 Tax=Lymnaea stagnalis TaxID=6523 RepID=A0AAV2IFR0_LYMST
MESARPKFEETVDLVELLTSNKVRDTKGLTRTPLASAKTRRACPKKGKMPGRTRKRRGRKKGTKEAEAGEQGEAAQSEEQQNDGGLASGVRTALSYDLQVPDLPDLDLSQQGHTKSNRGKATKTPISAPVVRDKTVEQVVPDEPVYNFYDFGDLAATTAAMEENTTPKSAAAAPASVNDRMVLSLQSSRFELPMDMRKLEKLTPQDYLRKYCVITTRRRSLYQKMYQKHRGKAGHIQGKFQLCEALKDVLVNTITYSQAEELCDLLEVDDETCVDLDLFSGMAALAERILYPEFLTEATADKTEYQKEKVECADFSALEWKLHGVKVSPPVRKILSSL